MIIPIRCYTCNKIIADKYRKYQMLMKEGKISSQDILEKELNLNRYCCKTLITSHIDIIENII
jgi:DNA-directed RNA polymerase I, II, and III subunit RPABC5